jgi:hypothetical protein
MSALAVLDAAQVLRDYWCKYFASILVTNSVKNVDHVSGPGSTGYKGEDHKLGWRDVYDVTIRWRQISEVNAFLLKSDITAK